MARSQTRMDASESQEHEIADEHYDVVSVIYHSLQGYETAKRYESDARDAGDEELAQFFSRVQAANLDLVNRGRHFLKEWVNREGVSRASELEGRSNVADRPLSATMGEASRVADRGGRSGDTHRQAAEATRDLDEESSRDRSQAV